MTARDIALTWSAIYKGLVDEFPKDKFIWNETDLHGIVTQLTIESIRSSTLKMIK